MYYDKAYLPLSLRRGVIADADDDQTSGGGTAPEPVDEAETQPEASPEAAEQAEPQTQPEEPSASAQEPAQPQEAPVNSSIDDDARAFEEALAAEDFRESGKVDYSGTFQQLREGDVVQGTVVHIDREGVLVDVGTKSEGVIRPNELTRNYNQNPEDVVSIGETISVFVLKTDTEDGTLILSKKRADFEVAWEKVEEASKTDSVITAMVTDRVKGGLVVDLGIRGFVPASHVGSGKVKNLDKYIGQSIPLKVVEVDRERRKVVLSHRMAVEEERDKKREETLTTLAEGQERSGIVRRITEYGAFVDLGGIDGLLHISEMAWTRINHPSEVVKVGQKIQVMVLKMSPDNGRISLGMRQILPDPWHDVSERFRVGDVINGKVSRLVPFGAFVQLAEGVEAIIPNSELSMRRIKKPEQVVSVGEDVDVKILEVRPEERRMTLSLRAVTQERDVAQAPQTGGRDVPQREQAPRATVADLLGDEFAARREEFERELNRDAKVKKARKKAKADAQLRAEEESYDDLDDELIDDEGTVDDVGADEEAMETGDEAVQAVPDDSPADDEATETIDEAPEGELDQAAEADQEPEAEGEEKTEE